jgi:hypothetical protein
LHRNDSWVIAGEIFTQFNASHRGLADVGEKASWMKGKQWRLGTPENARSRGAIGGGILWPRQAKRALPEVTCFFRQKVKR